MQRKDAIFTLKNKFLMSFLGRGAVRVRKCAIGGITKSKLFKFLQFFPRKKRDEPDCGGEESCREYYCAEPKYKAECDNSEKCGMSIAQNQRRAEGQKNII